MTETCIVCLGDLGESAPALPTPTPQLEREGEAKPAVKLEADNEEALQEPPPLIKQESESELIAHLLPCGHDLHDQCLKPWVERANSCPICRQNFNEVQLSTRLHGPVLSSYAVSDRTQVAELDPSMIFDEPDEPEFQPCRICGNEDNEDLLLLCSSCNVPHHIYCIGLAEIPTGHWFCEECAINRAVEESMNQINFLPVPSHTRRTRGQLRRRRNNAIARSSDWARIWETVLDRTSLDLDFPFRAELIPAPRRRRGIRRVADLAAWERRLDIAEAQGGADQLREAVPFLDSIERTTVSRPKPEPPEPESVEEIMAWNALEKARDIEAGPEPSRKRKSVTHSPAEGDLSSRRKRRRSASSPASPSVPAEPVHRLKRPRTRRAIDVADAGSDGAESSSSKPRTNDAPRNGAVPTFLQSLLKEVESSTPAEDGSNETLPALNIATNLDHPSPQYSSPLASPTGSNHPSPRALSTTPPPSIRSGSPAPLTSKIEPIYTMPEFSTERSPPLPETMPRKRPKMKLRPHSGSHSRTRAWIQTSDAPSPPPADDLSPIRVNMSLSAKENIQRLVKEALKEPHQANQVDKDQYTDINRKVSRMLYDIVGEEGDIDGSQSDDWKRMASDEVAKAVQSLQA